MRQDGFTLVELMVALAVLALLAAIAAPSFSPDSAESAFRSYVTRLAQDMRRGRFEALSAREDRSIFIPNTTPSTYSYEAVAPNSNTASPIQNPEIAPQQVEIAGVLPLAAEPGSSYLPPGELPAEIRFTGLNTVEVATGTDVGSSLPMPSSATIFLRSADDAYRARIVISGMTAHTHVYNGW